MVSSVQCMGVVRLFNMLAPPINQDCKNQIKEHFLFFEKKKKGFKHAHNKACMLFSDQKALSRWWKTPLNFRCKVYCITKNKGKKGGKGSLVLDSW